MRLETNEGLAQYTGTVTGSSSPAEATTDAIAQLARAEGEPTFFRSFAYPSGAAYGILLEADFVLVSPDGSTLTVPAPASVEGTTLTGDGWTVTLNPGWVVRPGPRAGDFRVERAG